MPVSSEAGTGAARDAVLTADQAFLTALVERDVDALDALLDPDFIAVHITGHQQSRADWLAQITEGGMAYHDVEEESARFQLEGDSAVLVTRNRVLATIWGSRARWPLESTTTYLCRDGRWRISRSAAITYRPEGTHHV